MRTLPITSLLLAVAIAATACGGPTAPEATSTPTTAASPSTAEATAEETAAPAAGETVGPTATPTPIAATEAPVSVDERDCSTQGRGVEDADLSPLPEAARATATLLLDAATRCDEPLLTTAEWQDDDEAWQEVVDARVLAADEAQQMRETGSGYLGWRIGIRGDGNWMFFIAGD